MGSPGPVSPEWTGTSCTQHPLCPASTGSGTGDPEQVGRGRVPVPPGTGVPSPDGPRRERHDSEDSVEGREFGPVWSVTRTTRSTTNPWVCMVEGVNLTPREVTGPRHVEGYLLDSVLTGGHGQGPRILRILVEGPLPTPVTNRGGPRRPYPRGKGTSQRVRRTRNPRPGGPGGVTVPRPVPWILKSLHGQETKTVGPNGRDSRFTAQTPSPQRRVGHFGG